MSWPQAQEYNEAIQNPHVCFADPDLKSGSVKKNAMGLPVPISGAFANVYQITTPTGKWAVRCFVREVKDSHFRYDEISKALRNQRPPYIAPFEYQRSGIRLASRTFPIVKMQWLQGELLNDFVTRNVNSPEVLLKFAEKWAAMIADLQNRKIAHGDLQHGNVLVVNGEPQLIDYDGMFVSAFQGLRSNEVGHPNFQHPQRRETDFGTFTDNFSAWIIYASLRVVATSPEIYTISRGLGRDEGLLFNKEDLLNPSASPVFGHLRQHRDETVVQLAQKIASFVTKSPRDVPPLDAAAFPHAVVASTGQNGQEWWRDHLPAGEADRSVQPPPLPPPLTLEIGPQPLAQREMFGMLVASLVAFAAGKTGAIGIPGYILLQTMMCIGAERRLRYHFSVCPAGSAQERHVLEVHLKAEEIETKTERLRHSRFTLTENERDEKVLTESTHKTIVEIGGIQGAEVKQAYSSKAVALADLGRKKLGLSGEERMEIQSALAGLERTAENLTNQINLIPPTKAAALEQALNKEYGAAIEAYLATVLIADATIPGIGPKFKQALSYRGIRTAADATFAAVRLASGFGYTRTHAVTAWRDGLAVKHRMRLGSQLSPHIVHNIERQFQTKSDELQRELNNQQAAMTAARNRISQAFGIRRMQLEAEERTIVAACEVRVTGINSKYSAQIATLRSDLEQKVRNLRKENANLKVVVDTLEADIQRLKNWQRAVGVPRTLSFNNSLTFIKFLREVFTTKVKL